MKNSILLASLILCTEAAVLEDTASDRLKPYYDPVMHRFYGPWNILRKRNGDYVDYDDYGGRIPDFLPSSPDLPRDGPPVFQKNLNEASANYGERFATLNSDDKWRLVGLADFRAGTRGDGIAAKGADN